MIIIKPSFEILTPLSMKMLSFIDECGRTCYKSRTTSSNPKKFVEKLIEREHLSVIEHISVSARVVCDRGVTHEIVRHRIASYSQESTRYCNYSKENHITFIVPCFFSGILAGTYTDFPGYELTSAEHIWFSAMLFAEQAYLSMTNSGCKPEEARSVLPNSLKTEIVITMNLREWRHFFRLRTASSAHPQMREIAVPMLEQFRKLPVIFDNL